MRDQIMAKMQEWQQGLESMQAQRVRVAQQLAELDAAIQRNIGAIAAGQEMLSITQPPAEELPDAVTE